MIIITGFCNSITHVSCLLYSAIIIIVLMATTQELLRIPRQFFFCLSLLTTNGYRCSFILKFISFKHERTRSKRFYFLVVYLSELHLIYMKVVSRWYIYV